MPTMFHLNFPGDIFLVSFSDPFQEQREAPIKRVAFQMLLPKWFPEPPPPPLWFGGCFREISQICL